MSELALPAGTPPSTTPRSAWVIVARSSITAAADRELENLCQRLNQRLPQDQASSEVRFAYTEQGDPALRQVLQALADGGTHEVRLLPLVLPMEPGFALSLQRVIKRWRHAQGGNPDRPWPSIRIAPAPSTLPAMDGLLEARATAAAAAPASDGARVPDAEGATIPAQRHRVLVCAGAPCTDAGANLMWGHLRNIQKARGLRTEGPGVMTCKTSCLGPCGLAPVMQVWPDGTWYGGVDEAALNRIVDEHLLGGRPVADWTYTVQPGKQWLRPSATQGGTSS